MAKFKGKKLIEIEMMNEEAEINRKEEVFTMWAQHQIWKTRTEGNLILTREKLVFHPGKINRKINPAKEERKEKSWDLDQIKGVKKKAPIYPWRYFEIRLNDGKCEVFVGRNRSVKELIDYLRSFGKEVS